MQFSMKIPAWEQFFGLFARVVGRGSHAATDRPPDLIGAAVVGVYDQGATKGGQAIPNGGFDNKARCSERSRNPRDLGGSKEGFQ